MALTCADSTAALETTWTGGGPPIVPTWAPQEVIEAFDKDRDGLLDAFEDAIAQAFVPQYRFATYNGLQDPGRRAGSLYQPIIYEEPVLLHQVIPRAQVPGSQADFKLRVRYLELFAKDTAGCGLVGHHGDTARHTFGVMLQSSPYKAVFDYESTGYSSFPGSGGRVVIFPTWGKHHHEKQPGDEGCDGVLGAGNWVDPQVWGSHLGFCEGSYVQGECEANWVGDLTPLGLINSLNSPPFAYPGETVYQAEPFAGGLGNPDEDVTPIREHIFHEYEVSVRLDLGTGYCLPFVAGTEPLGDTDSDGIPTGCDPCDNAEVPDVALWQAGVLVGFADSDDDGIPNGCDACPYGNDFENTNVDGEDVNSRDSVPDGCDRYASTTVLSAERASPVVSGTGYAADFRAGEIDISMRNNQAPGPQAENAVHTGQLTVRRCFCVNDNGEKIYGDDCVARDVPDDPASVGTVCIKNGVEAPASFVDTGRGWLPFRSYRHGGLFNDPVAPEVCVARRLDGTLEQCQRSVTTYAPTEPATGEQQWARWPKLTWDGWSEIEDRAVYGDLDVPAIPTAVRVAPPPVPEGNFPAYSKPKHMASKCILDPQAFCPQLGCGYYFTTYGIGYACIEAALPHGALGPGGFWTRLTNLGDPGPEYIDTPAFRRIHDGYLQTTIDIPPTRMVSGFWAVPVLAHRFVPPWLPVQRLPPLDLVATLGGTPAVFNVDSILELGLWLDGKPYTAAATDLGAAEPIVRGSTALALAGVRAPAPGEGPIDGLELWAFDALTGLLRHIESSSSKGYHESDSINSDVPPSEEATIAVTGDGEVVVAISNSPWRFFVIDGRATEELSVAGRWEELLALMPHADGVRALGIVSGGIRAPMVGYADLVRGETAAVHLLAGVPVRAGLWLGYGSDRRGSVVLIGGGNDEQGVAHSDVYAVDLSRGGAATRLIADDDGASIGPDAWITGERLETGWYLRAVPARPAGENQVRYGAYERLTALEDGWRPAGLSAIDAPRDDITTVDRSQLGSSCELEGAPWYAPPGRFVFNEDLSGSVLVCDQAIPDQPPQHRLPRRVRASALLPDALWTLSGSGLEQWDLEAS
ncbi:MAG: hypothetical protein DRI90_13390, partial [Deltaproteobacteria bacterium]